MLEMIQGEPFCPVCGLPYSGEIENGWRSWYSCPCCDMDFESGEWNHVWAKMQEYEALNDAESSFDQQEVWRRDSHLLWRKNWIDQGCELGGEYCYPDWNPREQLKNIGVHISDERWQKVLEARALRELERQKPLLEPVPETSDPQAIRQALKSFSEYVQSSGGSPAKCVAQG